jgi:pimeloyl-ACP methyl ester carboxylesterase
MRHLSRRTLKPALLLATTFLIVWLLGSFVVVYRLTRRARPRFPEPIPAPDWGRLEQVRLETSDGQEIGAWLVAGRRDSPSVLLIHGIGASRAACLGRAEILAREGYTVLMITLRAHGDSSGDYNDMGYSARHDIVAAVDLLERQRPGAPIVVHGLSMGAAAALFAAAELAHRVERVSRRQGGAHATTSLTTFPCTSVSR